MAPALWDRLTTFSNLVLAAEAAQRGKRSRADVAAFHFRLEPEICRLQDELRSKRYTPGGYRTFRIFDPKERLISAAPYRDRVVHHALCRVIEPIFDANFVDGSFACRRKKGTHAAVKLFSRYARAHEYVFQGDIAKFFPSIDLAILKASIARTIDDPDVVWLADLLIDSSNPQDPVLEWFDGDSLFTPAERRRGLPIGNQTSQFFANVYLDAFDHFVREELGITPYIRYVDDFVIFDNDKARLAEVRMRCRKYLETLRLRMHRTKSVISRVRDGPRFLGYRIFPTHRLLVRQNVVRMQRRLRKLQEGYAGGMYDREAVRRRLVGWIGHARHANTFRLRERMFRETSFVRKTD